MNKLSFSATFAMIISTASACTEIQLRSPTGELVVANSLEAANYETPLHATTSRRGDHHGGHTAGCIGFDLKYGFIAGMNEAGLSVNEHTLDLAVYQQPKAGVPNVCSGDLQSWALGLYATVAEVSTALKTVRVIGRGGGQWGFQDAEGQSIVVEYVKGELRLHNNTKVGVMTNDPTWDWHLQNLNNYVALQPTWYGTQNEALEVDVSDDPWYPWATNAYNKDPPKVPQPIGHAYNVLGIPGDGSPPARFIRAFYMRGYSMLLSPPKDLNDTLILGQELLNAVYKPLGTIPRSSPTDPLETTPISTLRVPQQRLVYTRSRQDMTWRMLDLKRIDFAARGGAATIWRAGACGGDRLAGVLLGGRDGAAARAVRRAACAAAGRRRE